MNITVKELKTRMDDGNAPALIDVREQYEHEEFNIGGQLIPLGDLPARIPELELETDRDIVVYCRSGQRSMMGQHLLKESGFEKVYNLEGGMLAWQSEIEE